MTDLVTIAEVKDFLTISSTAQDARLSNIIHYASDLIQTYCGRQFANANVSYEYQDGGKPYIYVNNPPINNLYEVAEYDGTQYVPLIGPQSDGGLPNTAANANSVIGYTVDSSTGKIWKGNIVTINSSLNNNQSFSPYAQGIRVAYAGGYDTIPGDVKLACLQLVKELHKGIDAQLIQFQREQIQSLPYSGGFTPQIRRILDLYRFIS